MSATTVVEPERILKDLRSLWSNLAEQDPNGVLRACAMTLVVVVEEETDAQAIGEMLASLMHEHPSRAIVLRVRNSPESVLEARVFAQCWMPFGRRQQICCEQVEIICSPASLADVAAVVRSLIVPDLPVVLFCPSEALWPLPEFSLLLPPAGKLVVDSCGMRESTQVLSWLPSIQTVERKADLVWSRLTPIRETVAQVFDSPGCLRSVYGLTEVQIMYKGQEEPSAVYYLAGWFMHVLGGGVKLKIAAGVGPEYANIAHVAMIGSKLEARIDITGRGLAEITVNREEPQAVVLPVANEYYALRQELSIAGRDRLFEDVLGLANLMRAPR
jgi:glucose-6-phosphate dehydrogenase assembly protein OpcA